MFWVARAVCFEFCGPNLFFPLDADVKKKKKLRIWIDWIIEFLIHNPALSLTHLYIQGHNENSMSHYIKAVFFFVCSSPLFLYADTLKGLTFQHDICFSEMSSPQTQHYKWDILLFDSNKCNMLHNHDKLKNKRALWQSHYLSTRTVNRARGRTLNQL